MAQPAHSLTLSDLPSVLEATFDARHKWRNILLTLRVSHATIDTIGERWRDDPDNCYREGLKEWLKEGERSWRDLVKALSNPIVGCNDIATAIERNYTQPASVTPGPTNTDCVQCKGDSMAVDQNTIRCVSSCSPQQYLVETSLGSGEYVYRDCHIDCNDCTGSTQAQCVKYSSVLEIRERKPFCISSCPSKPFCISSCPSNSFTKPTVECMPCNDQFYFSKCINGTTNLDFIVCAKQSVLVGGRTECIWPCEAGQVCNATSGQYTTDKNIAVAVGIACVFGATLPMVIIVIIVIIVFYVTPAGKRRVLLPLSSRKRYDLESIDYL